MNTPTLSEWKDLYTAAIRFRDIKCWEWMYDSDLFGVQNTEGTQIGYCSVLGNLGQVYGIAVYLGIEGLGGYLKLAEDDNVDDPELLHNNDCILTSFDNKEDLEKNDLQIINSLGLKFSGSHSRPLFRRYQPGYFPWYLNCDEVKFLTLVLQQAAEIGLQFRDNPKLLETKKQDYYFTRIYNKENSSWENAFIKPVSYRIIKPKNIVVDYQKLDSIKERLPYKNTAWEIDFFYMPGPVMPKGERPYYPYVFLWVDHAIDFLYNAHVVAKSKYEEEIPVQCIKVIENMKYIPKQIITRKDETFELLKPIADRLAIKLQKSKKLDNFDKAKLHMYNTFPKRK